MTTTTRKNLQQSLIAINKEHSIACTPEQAKALSDVSLVYRIQFLLIRLEREPFTQGEIDSLIYH